MTATTVVLGALAARDWRPMHHDHDFAVNRNGTRDIFLNTPNQAAWFERYVTDWTGPLGRLGRMKFRMKGSVFPGDTMVLDGTVTDLARRRRRLRLGRRCWCRSPSRATSRPTARCGSPCPPRPTTTPGAAAATSGGPEQEPVMDLDFSEEQDMLREMVRGVCADVAPLDVVREMEDDPVGYPDRAVEAARRARPDRPDPARAAYGGSGMTTLEAAIVYEEFGRSLAPSPHFASAVASAGALLAGGTDEQKQTWLPGIAKGEAILVPAWLEPGNGFGPDGVQLAATPAEGGGVVLDGVKWHVPFASSADRLVVLARTGDAASTCSWSTRPHPAWPSSSS